MQTNSATSASLRVRLGCRWAWSLIPSQMSSSFESYPSSPSRGSATACSARGSACEATCTKHRPTSCCTCLDGVVVTTSRSDSAGAGWFDGEVSKVGAGAEFIAAVREAAGTWSVDDLTPDATFAAVSFPYPETAALVEVEVPGLTCSRAICAWPSAPSNAGGRYCRANGRMVDSSMAKTRLLRSTSVASQQTRCSAASGPLIGWSASCSGRSFDASGTRRPVL